MTDKPILTTVNVEARKNLDIRPGDTVRVMQKIQEKGKTRLQAFEGLVLAVKHGNEAGGTFTVRKVASGVGVEKTFPLFSPAIDKIEVVKRTKVRQSKLYYIREKAAKVIRRSMRNAFAVGESIESDMGEKERLAREAEEAEKRAQEEAAAAEAQAAAEEAAKSVNTENEHEEVAEVREEAEEPKEEAAETKDEGSEPKEAESSAEAEPKKD